MSLGILVVGENESWPPEYPGIVYSRKGGGTPEMSPGQYVCRQLSSGFHDRETGAVMHVELVNVDQVPDNALANKLMGHHQSKNSDVYKQNWFPIEQAGTIAILKTHVDNDTAQLLLGQIDATSLHCPNEDNSGHISYFKTAA